MSDDFRPTISNDRTPIQQSLVMHPADNTHLRVNRLMLGVVLDVFPSDDPENRSATQDDSFRGFLHSCSVLVVNSNSPSPLVLNNVPITPSMPSGLDNYYECLPRPSSSTVDGEDLNPALAGIDPFTLDGDWCVVGFIGGNMGLPFVVSWWPHPRNNLDPATSGQGNPDRNGTPQALDQSRRYFKRVNGVEHVVTRNGDIYLSTHWAKSALKFDRESRPTEGRFPRNEYEGGGNVYASLKSSASLELSWNRPQDGEGILGRPDVSLPQTNPRPAARSSQQSPENTYVRANKDLIDITVPEEVKVTSKRRIDLTAEDATTIKGSSLLELKSDTEVVSKAPSIKLGAEASEPIILGNARISDESEFLVAFTAFIEAVSVAVDASQIAAAANALKAPLATWSSSIASHLSTKVTSE